MAAPSSSVQRATAVLAWRIHRLRNLAMGALRSLATRGIGETWARVQARRRPTIAASASQPSSTPYPAADHSAPCILFIDAAAPTPQRDSGSVRALRILQLCRELGWAVAFMPDNGQLPEESAPLLAAAGIERVGVAGQPRLDHWLLANHARLHAVVLARHAVAAKHLPLVRALSSARVLFDTVDLHHVRLERAADATGNAGYRREAEHARAQEFDLIARCDATVVVSHAERDYLQQQGVTSPVEVLSNVHDVVGGERNFDETQGLLFVGGYLHHPNREAITWLCAAIMPLLRQRLPGVVLHLVGDMPEASAAELRRDDVQVHGQVPSITPFLETCRINLAPLRSGAGVKGKINQAMSHGQPVVATHIAAEGMFLRHDDNALIADSAEEFAGQVARLYQDRALWMRLSANGYRNIEAHFSSALARRTLAGLLGSAPGH